MDQSGRGLPVIRHGRESTRGEISSLDLGVAREDAMLDRIGLIQPSATTSSPPPPPFPSRPCATPDISNPDRSVEMGHEGTKYDEDRRPNCKCLIFDLDDTLYPVASGIGLNIMKNNIWSRSLESTKSQLGALHPPLQTVWNHHGRSAGHWVPIRLR